MTPTERLKELARLLREEVPKEKFNLRNWLTDCIGETILVNPETSPSEFDPHECNTVACAVGWAMFHPPFNKEGFKAEVVGEYDSFDGTSCSIIEPAYDGMEHWNAVKFFFDLEDHVTDYLFMPQEGYNTPEQVADRIDEAIEHLAKGEKLHSYWGGPDEDEWRYEWRKD